MTMSLTYKQAELLAFIGRYQQDHGGVSPSFEQMKHALGLKSKSGVHRLIEALEERGRIARGHNRARCIEILAEPPPRSALATFSSRELVAELARRGFSRHAEREAA